MNQPWHALGGMPGVLAGTAIVAIAVGYQDVAQALTFNEVRQIARPVTVLIRSKDSIGSGVIIAKQGNVYTVLTNRHVVEASTAYQIQTSDTTIHSTVRVVRRFPEVDLAVVQFDSSKIYPVATLGNSDQIKQGDTIFSFGYPAAFDPTTRRVDPKYYEAEGIILAIDPAQEQGYLIKHRADTPRGMSGGPLFDAKGRLIAINGKHGSAWELREGVPTADSGERGENLTTGRTLVQVYNGEWFSIPINIAVKRLASVNVTAASLKIDNTPPPNNQERLAKPKNAGDFYLRASLAAQNGKPEAAIRDYSQTIQLNPDFLDAYFQRGLAYLTLNQPQSAIADFTEVVNRPSGNLKIYAYNNRGNAYSRLNNWKAAVDDYNQAIRLSPGIANFYYNRGNAKDRLGDSDGAIADYTQTLRLNPKDAEAYFRRGNVLSRTRQYQSAIKDFNAALQLNPKDKSAYNNRGLAYMRSGNWQAAIADYTQAIRLDPKAGDFYYNRGLAYGLASNFKSAVADYTEAIRLNPKDAEAYFRRGSAYTRLGDLQAAIKDFNQVIQLNPNEKFAYNNRGLAFARLGQLQTAIADYTKAIQLDPKAADFYYNRGLARTSSNDESGAIADFSEAVRLNPKDAEAYLRRGNLYLRTGKPDNAIADYQTAKQLFQQQNRPEGVKQAQEAMQKLQAK